MVELQIGILAEDKTDRDTVAILVKRILKARPGPGVSLSFKGRGRDGCGHLMRKARVWMAELVDEGCSVLLFVRDLDRNPDNNTLNDATQLQQQMERVEVPDRVSRYICIPIEELEAWFWSDPEVLERVAPGQGRGRAQSSPQNLAKPKEKLMRLSAGAHNGKARYTPQLNPELAEILNLDLCEKRCPAFRNLRAFVNKLHPADKA